MTSWATGRGGSKMEKQGCVGYEGSMAGGEHLYSCRSQDSHKPKMIRGAFQCAQVLSSITTRVIFAAEHVGIKTSDSQARKTQLSIASLGVRPQHRSLTAIS